MRKVLDRIGGGGIFARAFRSSLLTAGSYAFAQVLRLAANLVLTRLLFPEAFGIMTLVTVVLVGLTMFSDIGLGPAIAQNPKGDEPDFLNTAFTLNVLRGGALWLLTCAAALPVAHLYNAPDLALYLPVAGLTLLIGGFLPIRVETAMRHLMLGRVTALDLIAQVIGTASMVVLALAFRSVWALVIGGLIGSMAKVLIMRFFLPGPPSRLFLDRTAAWQLVHFGKWIFLSTACGFLLSQGDKAIFGAYATLEELGIYNIGYFLASFPMLLAGSVTGRIMIPIYRERHPAESPENARHLRRMRFLLTGGTLALLGLLGVIGPWLVGLLYDDRYAPAGLIIVLIAMVQMPSAIGLTYDQSALAAGNSRGYFLLMALKAGTQTAAFLVGIRFGGITGALIAQGAALWLLHPFVIGLARRHRAWDGLHDGIFIALALALCLLILLLHPVLPT